MHRLLYALLWAGLFTLPAGAADPKPSVPPEQTWARRVADDFFDAVLASDDNAVGLLSPELARSMAALYQEKSAWPYLRMNVAQTFRTATVTSEELAPDKSEVILKGVLAGKAKADFTVRVAREAGGGPWVIRFLRINWRDKD